MIGRNLGPRFAVSSYVERRHCKFAAGAYRGTTGGWFCQKWRKGKTSRRRENAKMIENAMVGLRYEYSYG